MPQGIDKRILRSRKALLCALPLVLVNKPLENVTVREIADAAGINRKTFYAHYSTPTELHNDLAEEVANAIIRRMSDRAEARPADFVAAVAKLAKEYQKELVHFLRLDNLAPLRVMVFSRLSVLLAEKLFPTSEHGAFYAASLIGSAAGIYGACLESPTHIPLSAIEEIHLACVNRGLA